MKKDELELGRRFPFTLKRRDDAVKRIMKETGVDKWTAEIAYRISTAGLIGKYAVEYERD